MPKIVQMESLPNSSNSTPPPKKKKKVPISIQEFVLRSPNANMFEVNSSYNQKFLWDLLRLDTIILEFPDSKNRIHPRLHMI